VLHAPLRGILLSGLHAPLKKKSGVGGRTLLLLSPPPGAENLGYAERRVTELIPVLGSQPAGDVSHKPSGRLPLLFARPAVTVATLKTVATNFAAW